MNSQIAPVGSVQYPQDDARAGGPPATGASSLYAFGTRFRRVVFALLGMALMLLSPLSANAQTGAQAVPASGAVTQAYAAGAITQAYERQQGADAIQQAYAEGAAELSGAATGDTVPVHGPQALAEAVTQPLAVESTTAGLAAPLSMPVTTQGVAMIPVIVGVLESVGPIKDALCGEDSDLMACGAEILDRGGDLLDCVPELAGGDAAGCVEDVLEEMAGTEEEEEEETTPPEENYSFYALASANTGFLFDALGMSVDTVGTTESDEEGEGGEGGEGETGGVEADPEAAEGMSPFWANQIANPANAGAFLAFCDNDVTPGACNQYYGGSTAKNAKTYSYDTFLAHAESGSDVSAAAGGVYAYGLFGASLDGLGLINYLDGAVDPTRTMMGNGMLFAFALSGSIDAFFGLIINALWQINPFRLFFEAVQNAAANGQNVSGYDIAQEGAAGPFQGLAEFISELYGHLLNMSWLVTVPLFMGLFLYGVLLFRRYDTGSNFKKLLVRIFFISLGFILLGSTYTSALESMRGYGTDSVSANSSKVVLNTYLDYEGWVNTSRLSISDPEREKIQWDAANQTPTDEAVASIRNTTYNINTLANPNFSSGANYDKISAGSDDMGYVGETLYAAQTGEDSDKPNSMSMFNETWSLLNRYINGDVITAETFEADVKAGLDRKILEAGSDEARTHQFTAFTDLNTMKTMEDEEVATYAMAFVADGDGLTMNGTPGEEVYFTSNSGACWSWAGFRINGDRLVPNDDCNLSPLAQYNFLNTVFSASNAEYQSPTLSDNTRVRYNHAAVSQVGDGMLSMLYWFSAMSILLSFVVIGIFYALSMLFSNLKRSVQLIAAVPFATLGFMGGIAKVIIYTIAMILEVIMTLFVYRLMQEFILAVPALLEAPLVEAFGGDYGGATFGLAVTGLTTFITNNLVIGSILTTLIATAGIIIFTVIALKLRGTLISALDEAVTNMVNKLLDTSVGSGAGGGGGGVKRALGTAGAMAVGHRIASGGDGGDDAGPDSGTGTGGPGGDDGGYGAYGGSSVGGSGGPDGSGDGDGGAFRNAGYMSAGALGGGAAMATAGALDGMGVGAGATTMDAGVPEQMAHDAEGNPVDAEGQVLGQSADGSYVDGMGNALYDQGGVPLDAAGNPVGAGGLMMGTDADGNPVGPNGEPLTQDANGNYVDAAGNALYNEDGQRLDAAGNPIPDANQMRHDATGHPVGPGGQPLMRDASGNYVDGAGNALYNSEGQRLDAAGNVAAETAPMGTDINGEPVGPNGQPLTQDAEGNYVDGAGNALYNEDGQRLDAAGNVIEPTAATTAGAGGGLGGTAAAAAAGAGAAMLPVAFNNAASAEEVAGQVASQNGLSDFTADQAAGTEYGVGDTVGASAPVSEATGEQLQAAGGQELGTGSGIYQMPDGSAVTASDSVAAEAMNDSATRSGLAAAAAGAGAGVGVSELSSAQLESAGAQSLGSGLYQTEDGSVVAAGDSQMGTALNEAGMAQQYGSAALSPSTGAQLEAAGAQAIGDSGLYQNADGSVVAASDSAAGTALSRGGEEIAANGIQASSLSGAELAAGTAVPLGGGLYQTSDGSVVAAADSAAADTLAEAGVGAGAAAGVTAPVTEYSGAQLQAAGATELGNGSGIYQTADGSLVTAGDSAAAQSLGAAVGGGAAAAATAAGMAATGVGVSPLSGAELESNGAQALGGGLYQHSDGSVVAAGDSAVADAQYDQASGQIDNAVSGTSGMVGVSGMSSGELAASGAQEISQGSGLYQMSDGSVVASSDSATAASMASGLGANAGVNSGEALVSSMTGSQLSGSGARELGEGSGLYQNADGSVVAASDSALAHNAQAAGMAGTVPASELTGAQLSAQGMSPVGDSGVYANEEGQLLAASDGAAAAAGGAQSVSYATADSGEIMDNLRANGTDAGVAGAGMAGTAMAGMPGAMGAGVMGAGAGMEAGAVPQRGFSTDSAYGAEGVEASGASGASTAQQVVSGLAGDATTQAPGAENQMSGTGMAQSGFAALGNAMEAAPQAWSDIQEQNAQTLREAGFDPNAGFVQNMAQAAGVGMSGADGGVVTGQVGGQNGAGALGVAGAALGGASMAAIAAQAARNREAGMGATEAMETAAQQLNGGVAGAGGTGQAGADQVQPGQAGSYGQAGFVPASHQGPLNQTGFAANQGQGMGTTAGAGQQQERTPMEQQPQFQQAANQQQQVAGQQPVYQQTSNSGDVEYERGGMNPMMGMMLANTAMRAAQTPTGPERSVRQSVNGGARGGSRGSGQQQSTGGAMLQAGMQGATRGLSRSMMMGGMMGDQSGATAAGAAAGAAAGSAAAGSAAAGLAGAGGAAGAAAQVPGQRPEAGVRNASNTTGGAGESYSQRERDELAEELRKLREDREAGRLRGEEDEERTGRWTGRGRDLGERGEGPRGSGATGTQRPGVGRAPGSGSEDGGIVST